MPWPEVSSQVVLSPVRDAHLRNHSTPEADGSERLCCQLSDLPCPGNEMRISATTRRPKLSALKLSCLRYEMRISATIRRLKLTAPSAFAVSSQICLVPSTRCAFPLCLPPERLGSSLPLAHNQEAASRESRRNMETTNPAASPEFATLSRRAFADCSAQPAFRNLSLTGGPSPEDVRLASRAPRIEDDPAARSLARQIEQVCRAA
jgi:hypothetical protein